VKEKKQIYTSAMAKKWISRVQTHKTLCIKILKKIYKKTRNETYTDINIRQSYKIWHKNEGC